MSSTAVIVLAAGASTRLGQPKQLLPYQKNNLLNTTISTAMSSDCWPVVVVLGAYATSIQQSINQAPDAVLHNRQWATGMGTSIKSGISWLERWSQPVEAVILTVCDQPFITAALFNQLVDTYKTTKKPIIASAYANTIGVPALFEHSFFPILKGLDKAGAKSVIKNHQEDVSTIAFPNGDIDIDTPGDYQKLLSRPHH